MQSAVDEIIFEDIDTLLQYKHKTDKNRVLLATTCHPVLKNLNRRNNQPILYTNERMADLFKNRPIAAFKRPRNLKDIVLSENKIRKPIAK